jgi:hypothetical protein
MNKPKLDLNKMTPAQLVSFANSVGGALVANETTFPDAPIAGADLQDLATALQDARQATMSARTDLRVKMSEQAVALKTVANALRRTSSYVENVAAGSDATIRLAGLNVRKPSARVGQLPAPRGLKARPETSPGVAVLTWEKVPSARSYLVQYAAGGLMPTEWPQAALITRTRYVFQGLTSATRWWFRVASVGAAGNSIWTDPVTVVTQ